MRTMTRLVLLLLLVAAAVPAAASSDAGFSGESFTYQPQVPVSALARPASWLDPSRMRLSTEFSFGTGFGGGSQGLQVTRLSYQLANPLHMRLSLGNQFGSAASRAGGGFFLEGLDLDYRPSQMFRIQVRYQDLRSPLQFNSRSGYSPHLWP